MPCRGFPTQTAQLNTNETTVPTDDRAGFVVKSIRDNEFDARCKFKLVPTNNSYFPEISLNNNTSNTTSWPTVSSIGVSGLRTTTTNNTTNDYR